MRIFDRKGRFEIGLLLNRSLGSSFFFFFMRGLITAKLKVLGTYPYDNDELIIAKRGSITSGSTSFNSLDGIGSNRRRQ